MPELVLHIGLPKTATTFLQFWLSGNRKLLAEHGVWTPAGVMVAHRLAVEATPNPAVHARSDVMRIRELGYNEALGEVVSGLDAGLFDTVALSSEYFRRANPELVKEQLSDKLGLATRIIVVLRRQDRLLESGYNQSVKAMGNRGGPPSPMDAKDMDWWQLVTRWTGVFGRDGVSVLNYDRSHRANSTLSDFLTCLSPALAGLDIASTKQPQARNESLPADLLEFKRLANQFGEFGLHELLQNMIADGYKGPSFRITPQMAREIIETFRESNDRVASEILNMDEPLFPDYDPEEEKAGVDLFGRLPTKTLAAVLAYHIKQTWQEIADLKQAIATLERATPPE